MLHPPSVCGFVLLSSPLRLSPYFPKLSRYCKNRGCTFGILIIEMKRADAVVLACKSTSTHSVWLCILNPSLFFGDSMDSSGVFQLSKVTRCATPAPTPHSDRQSTAAPLPPAIRNTRSSPPSLPSSPLPSPLGSPARRCKPFLPLRPTERLYLPSPSIPPSSLRGATVS